MLSSCSETLTLTCSAPARSLSRALPRATFLHPHLSPVLDAAIQASQLGQRAPEGLQVHQDISVLADSGGQSLLTAACGLKEPHQFDTSELYK